MGIGEYEGSESSVRTRRAAVADFGRAGYRGRVRSDLLCFPSPGFGGVGQKQVKCLQRDRYRTQGTARQCLRAGGTPPARTPPLLGISNRRRRIYFPASGAPAPPHQRLRVTFAEGTQSQASSVRRRETPAAPVHSPGPSGCGFTLAGTSIIVRARSGKVEEESPGSRAVTGPVLTVKSSGPHAREVVPFKTDKRP